MLGWADGSTKHASGGVWLIRACRADFNVSPNMACSSKYHLGDHCPMLSKLGNLKIKHCKIIAVNCA